MKDMTPQAWNKQLRDEIKRVLADIAEINHSPVDLESTVLALECCLHFKAHDENGEVPDLFFQAADAAFATAQETA